MPISRKTLMQLLLLMGPLSAQLLLFKVLKFYRISEGFAGGFSLLTLFQIWQGELLFLLALGLLFTALLESVQGKKYTFISFCFQTTVFSLLVLSALEHGFFVSTGSLANWYLVKYGVTHIGNISSIALSEIRSPKGLLLLLPLAYVGFAWWIESRKSVQNWLINDPLWEKGVGIESRTTLPNWPKAWWIPALLLFLLLTPSTFHASQLRLAPLQTNPFAKMTKDFFSDMVFPSDISKKLMRQKPALFDTANLHLKTTPKTDKKNIVLVILESTRSRSLTPYNPKRPTTPFLNELAKKSLLFEDMNAVLPHTSKALVGILCGLYPKITLHIGEGDINGIPGKCIPKLLGSIGYQTAFFQTATTTFEGRAQLLENMGFKTIVGHENLQLAGFSKTNYFGYEDKAMLKPSLKWVDKALAKKKPFLLTYLTLVSHHTYTTPPSFKKKKYTESKDKEFKDYLNALRYQDNFLKELFAGFKKRGMYKNTIFLLVGDHGEAFDEHQRRQHDNIMWDEGLRIPMMIFHPSKIKKGKRIGGLRQQIDILPTVAELLGVKATNGIFPGKSLLKPVSKKRKVYFACWYENQCLATRQGDKKIIFHYGIRPMGIYDVVKDPLEKNNLLYKNKSYTKSWKDEVSKELREWKARVNLHYDDAAELRIAKARSLVKPKIKKSVNVRFGPYIEMTGYNLQAKTIQPGGIIDITYIFRARRKIPKKWRLFFHLEGDKIAPGQKKAFFNLDHHPVGGAYPVHKWRAGEYIKDHQRILVPITHFPPGSTLSLYLGSWAKGSGRLPIIGKKGSFKTDGNKRLLLAQIKISTKVSSKIKVKGTPKQSGRILPLFRKKALKPTISSGKNVKAPPATTRPSSQPTIRRKPKNKTNTATPTSRRSAPIRNPR